MLRIGVGLCDLPIQSSSAGDGSNPDLNVPTLVVQEGGVDTHAETEPADLTALVTVDDGDGSATTDVELYVNGALISSMDDDGGGDWSLAIPAVTAGTKNYRAKRITADGFRWSAVWQVVVSPVLGDFLTDGGDTLTIGGDPLENA